MELRTRDEIHRLQDRLYEKYPSMTRIKLLENNDEHELLCKKLSPDTYPFRYPGMTGTLYGFSFSRHGPYLKGCNADVEWDDGHYNGAKLDAEQITFRPFTAEEIAEELRITDFIQTAINTMTSDDDKCSIILKNNCMGYDIQLTITLSIIPDEDPTETPYCNYIIQIARIDKKGKISHKRIVSIDTTDNVNTFREKIYWCIYRYMKIKHIKTLHIFGL